MREMQTHSPIHLRSPLCVCGSEMNASISVLCLGFSSHWLLLLWQLPVVDINSGSRKVSLTMDSPSAQIHPILVVRYWWTTLFLIFIFLINFLQYEMQFSEILWNTIKIYHNCNNFSMTPLCLAF